MRFAVKLQWRIEFLSGDFNVDEWLVFVFL